MTVSVSTFHRALILRSVLFQLRRVQPIPGLPPSTHYAVYDDAPLVRKVGLATIGDGPRSDYNEEVAEKQLPVTIFIQFVVNGPCQCPVLVRLCFSTVDDDICRRIRKGRENRR